MNQSPQNKLNHFTEVFCNQASPRFHRPAGGIGAEQNRGYDAGPNPGLGVGSLSPTM